MDFSGRIFLAALEEDNEQRSLFRVRLLVDENGMVDPEEMDLLGDEGCLRIVPDRQEQYTFKERLRLLGPVCLVDLKHSSPELMKVRPNKNYAPTKGEYNQYVLYSDTVHAIHSQPVYEVVANPGLVTPLTRGYYLRKGGNIQGPYDRETGDLLDALSCIAPDSDKLFAVELPDGREHMFFWPRVVAGQTQLQRRPENLVPPPAYDAYGWQAGQENNAAAEEAGTPAEQPEYAEAAPSPSAQTETADSTAQAAPEEAAAAIAQALGGAGFAVSADDAMNLLLCLLLFPRVRLKSRHLCDAMLAAETLAKAVEAQWVAPGSGDFRRQRGFRFSLESAKGQEVQLVVDGDAAQSTVHSPWPVISLDTKPGFTLPLGDMQTVQARPEVLLEALAATKAEATEELTQPLADAYADADLPLALRRDMLRYVQLAAPRLAGGRAAAMQYVNQCFVAPWNQPHDTL